MGFFKTDIEKEGRGVDKNASSAPAFVRFFKVLGGRFWQLVVLNALYFFTCLPIITIGPATAGLTYVLRNFSQGKPVEPFSDFFAKCKEHFKQGIIVFLINIIVFGGGGYSAYLWSSDQVSLNSTFRIVGLVVVLFVMVTWLFANYYIFPMMVSFDLPLKKLIKNSIILGGYTIFRNIAMTVISLAMIIFCFYLFPLSIILILFIAFAFCILANQFFTFPILLKYVATPEEKIQTDEEDQIFSDNRRI